MTMLLAMSMTETLSESVFVTYANGSACAAATARRRILGASTDAEKSHPGTGRGFFELGSGSTR